MGSALYLPTHAAEGQGFLPGSGGGTRGGSRGYGEGGQGGLGGEGSGVPLHSIFLGPGGGEVGWLHLSIPSLDLGKGSLHLPLYLFTYSAGMG